LEPDTLLDYGVSRLGSSILRVLPITRGNLIGTFISGGSIPPMNWNGKVDEALFKSCLAVRIMGPLRIKENDDEDRKRLHELISKPLYNVVLEEMWVPCVMASASVLTYIGRREGVSWTSLFHGIERIHQRLPTSPYRFRCSRGMRSRM
jgi:hypothetical protein